MKAETLFQHLADWEERLLDKLSADFLPEVYFNAQPGSMVIQLPDTPARTLMPDKQFRYQASGAAQPLTFTPVTMTRLHGGKVKYCCAGASVWEVLNAVSTKTLPSVRMTKSLPENEIWIGLEMEDAAVSVQEIPLLLTIFHPDYSADFEIARDFAQWMVEGAAVQIRPGYTEHSPFDSGIHAGRRMAGAWNRHFVRLHISSGNVLQAAVPAALADCFDSESSADLQLHRLVWLGIRLPAGCGLAPDWPEHLRIGLNCFPVVCREAHQTQSRTPALAPALPLPVAGPDQYLESIARVLFDDKDVPPAVSSRPVNATHPVLSWVFHQQIDFNKKSNGDTGVSLPTVEIRGATQEGLLSVRYFTTPGATGLTIDPGSRLSGTGPQAAWEDTDIFSTQTVSNDAISVSPLADGTRPLSPQERNTQVRFALHAHGKIVTATDLALATRVFFGNAVADIRVEKGVKQSPPPTSGLIRTVDVCVQPAAQYPAPWWEVRCQAAAEWLSSRACMALPIRVMLQHP